MKKILSISIASYNVEEYVAECLDSVIVSEILDELEVLIIDDGSTDSTAKIAQTYCEKYPDTFCLIKKENGGWGSTVNKGIEYATGKYFKLLDADDFFVADHLATFICMLKTASADMILTPYGIYNDDEKQVSSRIGFGVDFREGEEYLFEEIAKGISVAMHAITVRTDLLKRNHIRIMEHCFYTDAQYVVKICCFVRTVIHFNQTIYCYRVNREGQSCSITGFLKHHEEHKRVIIQCAKYIDGHAMPENVRKANIERVKELVQTQYHIYWNLPGTKSKEYIVKWDNELKQNYPDYYELADREICVERWFNFRGMKMLHSIFVCCHVLKNAFIWKKKHESE